MGLRRFRAEQNPLTFQGFDTSEAVWSPDNSHFAVNVAPATGTIKTIVKALSGTGPETIVHESEPKTNDAPTDWSPDGGYLLAERYVDGKSELWLLPLTSGETARPLLPLSTTQGLQTSEQFSPDGKFVAFTLAVSSGPQVFIVPFPSGNGMWQVSVDGGHWPRWRRDGKELYFVSLRNVLTAVDVRPKGDSLEVGHPVPSVFFPPWARVSSRYDRVRRHPRWSTLSPQRRCR